MAYIVMAYIVMAYINGLYSYGLYRHLRDRLLPHGRKEKLRARYASLLDDIRQLDEPAAMPPREWFDDLSEDDVGLLRRAVVLPRELLEPTQRHSAAELPFRNLLLCWHLQPIEVLSKPTNQQVCV